MALSGGQFLKELRSTNPHLALLLEQMLDGLNSVAMQTGTDPKGKISPPPPIENFNVAVSNGTVNATITHNAPIQKGIRYFVEADINPAFSNSHVFDLGTSRSLFTALPNNGDQPWYFRAYAQYPGSDANEKVNFGEKFNPTPVTVGGIAHFIPLPSTGSGTAAADGSQPGTGLGPVQNRPQIGPKRSMAPEAT